MQITPNDIGHMTDYLNEATEDQFKYVESLNKEVEETRRHLVQLMYDLEMEQDKLNRMMADLDQLIGDTVNGVEDEMDLIDTDEPIEFEMCDGDCEHCADFDPNKVCPLSEED